MKFFVFTLYDISETQFNKILKKLTFPPMGSPSSCCSPVTKISGVVLGCAMAVAACADVGVPPDVLVNVVAMDPIPDENEPRGIELEPPSEGSRGPVEEQEIS